MPLTILYIWGFVNISRTCWCTDNYDVPHFKEHGQSYRIKPTTKFRNVQILQKGLIHLMFSLFIKHITCKHQHKLEGGFDMYICPSHGWRIGLDLGCLVSLVGGGAAFCLCEIDRKSNFLFIFAKNA